MSDAMRRLDEGDGDDIIPMQDDESPDDGGQEPPKKKRRKVLDVLLLVLAIVLLCGALVSGYIALRDNHQLQAQTHGVTDMSGNPVIPDDSGMFDPSFSAAASEVQQITPSPTAPGAPVTGLRFQVPSLGMNVPLGAINAVDGELNPANYTSAFWVRNMGVSYNDPSSGTVYIVMHSVRTPGFAPGNYLFSVAGQDTTLKKGDTIEVAGHTYTFTDWRAVSKPDLKNQLDIWNKTPGRLVIITCLQNREHTFSETNLVITATLTS
ncbi:MAG: class F sortase [Propionibacteriaceae bacterium]|nr:class F sortase [Propionibacteriaceae bacterium]